MGFILNEVRKFPTKIIYLFLSLCFQLLINTFFDFSFDSFSLSFEGYVDSSFSYRLFFCLGLRFSPNDDDDDDANSDSLLFDNISLVIDSFLAFPSYFTSKYAGANSWHSHKKRIVWKVLWIEYYLRLNLSSQRH